MAARTISPAISAVAFVVLVGLTVATVSFSFLRMGPAGHLAVGLAFGVAKAFLVALIFMHLVRSPARTWLAAGVGLFWLGILMTLTMSDYFTRAHAAY
jgi:cytochrome c oxidase subunit 4